MCFIVLWCKAIASLHSNTNNRLANPSYYLFRNISNKNQSSSNFNLGGL